MFPNKPPGKGGGGNLGARCTKDEQTLIEMRSKKLCVYVGKQSTKKMNITTAIKHRFCCFGNLLDKVIQVEGRKQLGRSFGSGSAPNCRGLSLEDIQRIDWNLVDFGEFIDDLKIKFARTYKTPKAGDLASTVGASMESIRKYDDDPSNQANNMSGWNGNVRDASSEADEERRLKAERLERERLSKLEAERLAQLERERLEREKLAAIERLEKERLASLERERLAGVERERKRKVDQQRVAKQQQINATQNEYDRASTESQRLFLLSKTENNPQVRDSWWSQSQGWYTAAMASYYKLIELKKELEQLK